MTVRANDVLTEHNPSGTKRVDRMLGWRKESILPLVDGRIWMATAFDPVPFGGEFTEPPQSLRSTNLWLCESSSIDPLSDPFVEVVEHQLLSRLVAEVHLPPSRATTSPVRRTAV
jgi:hypothetical protein